MVSFSTNLLKIGIKELAPSIANLINFSITTKEFPTEWKTARVAALFKAGDLTDVNNFRPISILPALSKIIERHVHDILSQYLKNHNLIYSSQSGFREKYSTETALVNIINSLLMNIDNNQVNGMLLVDYKKAFDMVDHQILFTKLELYGLGPDALNWFKSYLSNRRHEYVQFKGKSSPTRFITEGVPQGSILGPHLFLLFINDLPLHIQYITNRFICR